MRIWSVVAWLALPAAGLAQPAVSILAPANGDCVNNQEPVFRAAVGGQLDPPVNEVPLRVRFSEGGGAVVTLTVAVEGQTVLEELHAPAQPGQPRDLVVRVPADALADGPGRNVRVTASAGGQSAAAEVTFDLDRAPPSIAFDEGIFDVIGQCVPDGPPQVEYDVADDQDPSPVIEEAVVQEGCEDQRIITVRDHCAYGEFPGNALDVVIQTRRAPAGAIQVIFEGIDEGQTLVEGVLHYRVEGPAGCVEGSTASLTRDDDEPLFLVDGAVIDVPGRYVARVEVTTCAGQPVAAERRFTVVPPPTADPGGPYDTQQGQPLMLDASGSNAPQEVGGIAEYAWDLNNDGFFDDDEGRGVQVPFDTDQPDGVYPVGLRVTTGNGIVLFGYTQVRIADVSPTCDAGGPYEVAQGVAVQIDGSGSRPGSDDEPIVAYGWDFGDDRFPQRGFGLARVTHRYEAEGQFTVTLTVEDADSWCQDTARVTVTDIEPVIRNLHARDADGLVEGGTLTFDAGQTSAGSAAEPIIEYRWDFGDGSPPLVGPDIRGPSHTYTESGDFEVCLEVADADSTARGCISIHIADLVPFARLTGPNFALEGQSVELSAAGSRAGGPADPLRRYVWDFGDGSPQQIVDNPAQTTVQHAFAGEGRLTVTLRVEDEDSFREATHAIFIDDATPTVALDVQYGNALRVAFEGEMVTLDASASAGGAESDPIVVYRWDFGDGTTAEGADERVVEHTWADDGTYSVRLTVEDSDGSRALTEVFVEVQNRPPQNVRIVAEGDAVGDQIEVGREATFTVEYDDVPGDPAQIRWAMGDGSGYQNRVAVTHRYEAMGLFTLRVEVDDGDGGVTTASREIRVIAAGPRILAPPEVEGVEGVPLVVQFDVESALGGDGGFDGPVTLQIPVAPRGATWSVEDGPIPAQLRRARIEWTPGYASAGEHRVVVTALSPAGVERRRNLVLRIADAGTPMVAAAHGTTADARISLYAYRYDSLRRVDEFVALAEVPVGKGVGGVAVSDDGRTVFAAVPGSGAVAVVVTDGASARFVRRVPVHGHPQAVAVGAGHVWAVDPVAGAITAIDIETLKVVATAALPGLDGPVDVAWVPGGLGINDPHLAIVTARGGQLALVNAPAVLTGEGEIVRRVHRLGRRLHRVLVDADADRILVADEKARALYTVSVTDAVDRRTEPEVGRIDLPFGADDLAWIGDDIWIASAVGLGRVDAEGRYQRWADEPLAALAVLSAEVYGAPGLVLGARNRVANVLLGEGLQTLSAVRGRGASRLRTFIVR